MIKRKLFIPVWLLICTTALHAQANQQEEPLRREVTLYNPYRPSLSEVQKRSFLPEMNDTLDVTLDFNYNVTTEPFQPAYAITPIRAAVLQPDPLPRLYKSYINAGFGNYVTPLAEISITNERSRKGSIGFFGHHFSTNGKVKLKNDNKVFAGLMDNEVSLFGRRTMRNNVFEGSLDYNQNTRYAYGYYPEISDYSPEKKDIRLMYTNIGGKASLTSNTTDSTDLSYDIRLGYNYFHQAKRMFQHHALLSGKMAGLFKGFYIGSDLGLDFYKLSDLLLTSPKYMASVSPFISKRSSQWMFNLGFEALIERNMDESPRFHIYPDINFGFSVIPSYLRFFTGLSGKLEMNDPENEIFENPFLVPDGSLFYLPNTDHELIVFAGLKGNTGMEGNYLLSASYSIIDDMLLYSNVVLPDTITSYGKGNYLSAFTDDSELLNIHGELSGSLGERLSFMAEANYYDYTLSLNDIAWNKPDWDGRISFDYNLRDKIIAEIEISAMGKRDLIINGDPKLPAPAIPPPTDPDFTVELPAHVNLNLKAEYRYTKILSFWVRAFNIGNNRYYEWAFYPSQRFIFMAGFTYSL